MFETDRIFAIDSPDEFNDCCMEIFRFQAEKCAVYRDYLSFLGTETASVRHFSAIPFLPIELFKAHDIISDGLHAEMVFSSSGTTGLTTSKHFVAKLGIYEYSYRTAFKQFYGDPRDIAILALLPAYLERQGSSLIYMADDLIRRSKRPESGYFLYNHEDLFAALHALKQSNTKTILLGVTYALLDFIESYTMDFPDLIVMETGGMKGRRKEMIRAELHEMLCSGFGVSHIHSEYGMTELLSQGYSQGHGRFYSPSWMNILIRETNDPFGYVNTGKTGAINVIDLANIYSCSFIATQDLGKKHTDGSFEVLGRFDHSDVRGCNLLVQ